MRLEKSCGCIILNDKNEILLIQQIKGHWGFPKGHVEKGETEKETAIREVKEETNIDVMINLDNRYTTKYILKENVEKEVIFFIAKSITNNVAVQKSEIKDAKWLKIDEAIELATYDDFKNILKEVKKELKL